MRKNKGYKKKREWTRGENISLEQYIDTINKAFDKRIETCKKDYAKISSKTTLEGEDLYKYCRDSLTWEIKFDIDYDNKEYKLIPLEKALEMLEEDRHKTLGRWLYGKYGAYQKRIVHKDNQKFVYNSSGNGAVYFNSIRVPSLKRSNATWKRFYELFPEAKGLKTFRGCKLKKV